jgi:hypothetical protein
MPEFWGSDAERGAGVEKGEGIQGRGLKTVHSVLSAVFIVPWALC